MEVQGDTPVNTWILFCSCSTRFVSCFSSLLYFKWVGNVLWAGNGNGCVVSTAVSNKPVEVC